MIEWQLTETADLTNTITSYLKETFIGLKVALELRVAFKSFQTIVVCTESLDIVFDGRNYPETYNLTV